jgi:hypothetical protein
MRSSAGNTSVWMCVSERERESARERGGGQKTGTCDCRKPERRECKPERECVDANVPTGTKPLLRNVADGGDIYTSKSGW